MGAREMRGARERKVTFFAFSIFFINYENTALQIFFFVRMFLVVNGETDKFLGVGVCVSFPQETHKGFKFVPRPLIVHGLPVSCPFNSPNGNLKQHLLSEY